jgi:hypothetical protein
LHDPCQRALALLLAMLQTPAPIRCAAAKADVRFVADVRPGHPDLMLSIMPFKTLSIRSR